MTFRRVARLSRVAERHHVDEIRSALIIKLPRVPLIVYHEGVARAHCVSWPDFTRRRRLSFFLPSRSWTYRRRCSGFRSELIYQISIPTEAANRELFTYTAGYYNRRSVDSALGHIMPE